VAPIRDFDRGVYLITNRLRRKKTGRESLTAFSPCAFKVEVLVMENPRRYFFLAGAFLAAGAFGAGVFAGAFFAAIFLAGAFFSATTGAFLAGAFFAGIDLPPFLAASRGFVVLRAKC
jgi:hypothetical protein